MQRLVLPIDNCAFSAAYKNQLYLKQMKFPHYGVDLYSLEGNQNVYACGEGEVIAAGMDGKTLYSAMGNAIVIVYKDCWSHEGNLTSLACRMFHFESVAVKAGDKVTKDTVIGKYGNTGGVLVNGKPMGKHLHIEFDRDIKYPAYAYGIRQSGNVIKKGTVDSTVNPSDYWNLDCNQKIRGIYKGWYDDNDINLPVIEKRAK